LNSTLNIASKQCRGIGLATIGYSSGNTTTDIGSTKAQLVIVDNDDGACRRVNWLLDLDCSSWGWG
jgi:hypothetical protein